MGIYVRPTFLGSGRGGVLRLLSFLFRETRAPRTAKRASSELQPQQNSSYRMTFASGFSFTPSLMTTTVPLEGHPHLLPGCRFWFCVVPFQAEVAGEQRARD